MNRLFFGFFLAAAIALPANWNVFKRSKDAPATAAKDAQGSKAKSDSQHEFDSQYTGGTIAHIPQFTNGKLDLSDSRTLRFHYGKPTWSLDYAKISSIEVADKKMSRMIKVPKLMKDKRVFTIGFAGDKGKQTMVVELPIQAALTALPLLEERTGKAAVVEGAQSPDGWWGDRYWRTASNTQVWDDATGRNKTAVAAK